MNNKGSALMLTLGMVAILSVICVGYGARVLNEAAIAKKNVYSAQAFWISEAGIQKATWDYDKNNCRGMRNLSDGSLCSSCVSCGSGTRTFTGSLGNGDYYVVLDPTTKTYVSTGTVRKAGGASNQALARRKIKLFFGRDYIFGFAAFAQGKMDIGNNSIIDSFNSDVAPYDAATAGVKGNMGTNGSLVNVVDIDNNAVIKGSVSTGPGGTVDYMPSKVVIIGGITHDNDIYIEPVTVPAELQSAPVKATMFVTGTATLTDSGPEGGIYHLPKIAIGNNGTVNVSGDVKIYLTDTTSSLTTGNNTVAFNIADGGSVTIYAEGAIDLGNKVLINNSNVNPKPADFLIFSRYAGPNGVVIDNNNYFYGAVYAPLTKVEVSNNGHFYGAIVGNEVEVSNNGNLHYDQALGSLKAPWQPNELRDWQEQFN